MFISDGGDQSVPFSDTLTGSQIPSVNRAKQKKTYVGMIEFKDQDEHLLIKSLITGNASPALHANLLVVLESSAKLKKQIRLRHLDDIITPTT